MSEPRSVSAVVPAYRAATELRQSLPALAKQLGTGLAELIVVDDGSPDDTADVAASLGARVLRQQERRGPAAARNRGAQDATGELLLFVDADVVIRGDALEGLLRAVDGGCVVAAFGSYDDAPPAANLASRYANLRHHHGHQRGGPEASTFWAGLGLVRRLAFLESGGFDADRYRTASVEDIELGYRLRARGGRIRLVPDAQGTHLKRWTLRSLIATDVLKRALPWSELLLSRTEAVPALNVAPRERVAAGIAAALAAATLAALAGLLPAWTPIPLLALAALANAPFLALVLRRSGPAHALGALLLHQLYYLYSGASYLTVRVRRALAD